MFVPNLHRPVARLTCATALPLSLLIAITGCTKVPKPDATRVIIASPARAGVVQGRTENSDAFLWRLFTKFAPPVTQNTNTPRPVVFETWASDKDTFSLSPHWPTSIEPLNLHMSVLGALSTPGALPNLSDFNKPLLDLIRKPVDASCDPPAGAAVGGFPTIGTPPPCIAEQVARNRVEYDYIVNNHLNTQAGLAIAYKNSLNVEMPTDAVGLKGDWVPVTALQRWVPKAGD